MSIRTLNELFYRVVDRSLDSVMMFREADHWVSLSSRELYRKTLGVARALEDWGISRGERVAILSENRPEWAIADFATMLIGGATVPVYATLTPEQTLHLLRDSGARVIFLSSKDQLSKFRKIQQDSVVARVVVMDSVEDSDVIQMRTLMESGPDYRDSAFDLRALSIEPDCIATLIYTSGTTGTPKGAMLSQGNLASNLLHSLDLYNFRPRHILVSFLPLSHVTARHVDYAMLMHGVTVAYCPFHDQLMTVLKQVRPHFFVGVPRVYEKMANAVQSKAQSGLKGRIARWAMNIGRAHKDTILEGKIPKSLRWKLANRLFFSKVRNALGGRIEFFVSGGAPLSREVLDWYASIGIRIYEGYGLTETSPVIALNNPSSYRPGSVGRVLKNVQVQIAGDNEVLVKGPSIFKGYWNLPHETAIAFDGDWFHTGDVGHVDEDGFLFITDRKKDLIKTSGGKFIAPQPIEGKLKAHPFVAEAAVIADRRKFASAVIAPDFVALEEWARHNKISFAAREDLLEHPHVLSLFEDVIAGVNQELAQFERIKKFLLVPDEFSIESGALTPTMKLKRRFIEQRFRHQIDQLYNNDVKMQKVS